jgi:pimeloyl-ACP methyl ester carboxylesterase
VPLLTRPDGCRLNYELHGSGGDPMILLEGLGGDVPGWRRNIPELSKRLRVVAYDFRGNGASDEPAAPCTMGTFVQDTLALADHLGLERFLVYGQSFGGMVAQELTLTEPRRIASLILACTHCGGSHVTPVPDRKTSKGESWRSLYSDAFVALHPDHVAEDLRIGSMQPRHPVGGRRQWEAMQAFDTYDRLPQIQTPTLILHGTADKVVAPANAEVLASRIPGAELVWLSGAGHLYHSEQAGEADAAVLSFVGRHPA